MSHQHLVPLHKLLDRKAVHQIGDRSGGSPLRYLVNSLVECRSIAVSVYHSERHSRRRRYLERGLGVCLVVVIGNIVRDPGDALAAVAPQQVVGIIVFGAWETGRGRWRNRDVPSPQTPWRTLGEPGSTSWKQCTRRPCSGTSGTG